MKYPIICALCVICGCNGLSIDPVTKKIILPPKVEQLLVKVDKLAESVPVLIDNTQEVLDTPAGKLIPEPIKNTIGLGIFSLQTVGLLWLRMRKNLFQSGFNELAMSNELYYTNGGDSKAMMDAESRAINPPTLKLMKNEGYRCRVIDN